MPGKLDWLPKVIPVQVEVIAPHGCAPETARGRRSAAFLSIRRLHFPRASPSSVGSNKAVAAIRSTARNQHDRGDDSFSGDERRSVPPTA